MTLGVPDDNIKDPLAYRTLNDLIITLVYPPAAHLYPKDKHGHMMHDRAQIRVDWVKKTVSEKHFIYDLAKSRCVLRADSKIRTHGMQYGLPKRYYDWLCSNELDTSVFKGNGRYMVWMERADFFRRG
jgi:hypothetical protein